MKKIILFIVLLIVTFLVCGCSEGKKVNLISNFNLIRIKIIEVDNGSYYIDKKNIHPSGADEETTDYIIMNVEVLECYTDLVEHENNNRYQKDMILRMGIPAAAKEELMKYDEFILLPTSRDIYEYGLDNNRVEVDLIIEYVINARINSIPVLHCIAPIKNRLIEIQNDNFDFSYIYQYDMFVKESSKKLIDGLNVDEFEEWFKEVYNRQMKLEKNRFCIIK